MINRGDCGGRADSAKKEARFREPPPINLDADQP
jgi:hypothetical protein